MDTNLPLGDKTPKAGDNRQVKALLLVANEETINVVQLFINSLKMIDKQGRYFRTVSHSVNLSKVRCGEYALIALAEASSSIMQDLIDNGDVIVDREARL